MGKKNSTSTSQVTIPPEVLARYNAVNARAESVAQTPFQKYGTQPSDFVAQINAQQGAGIADINATAGSYQPFMDKATTATQAGMGPAYAGINNYMSPYIQSVADTTGAMMRQSNEQAQSGALGTAVSSGAFGGDRAGIAAANLNQQNQMAYGKTMADIMNQGYTQALGASQADLARQMAGGAQMAGLGAQSQQLGLQGAQAKIAAGTMQQQTEQAGKDAMINQFMQEKGYPFQVAQYLANIAMGTGAASGSTTTAVQPTSFFSDRRLKEDIQRIGEGDNGLPIYKYRYKGEPDTHIGFMADEVEKVNPDAVGLHPTGYKTVDYDRATKAEGGVAGPYGSSAGSHPGLGGYVPEAGLTVGQLMTADPSFLENAQASLAEQLNASANFGTNLAELKQTFGKDGDFWMSNEQRRALDAANQRTAHGGVVNGYASGGPAYMRPDNPQMGARTYLSDTLDAQSDQDDRSNGLAGPAELPKARTTGQDMADIAKVAMMFMGMNRGGRTGYATNGAVEDMTSSGEMTPKERQQYIADLRAFSTRNPGVARDAAATGLNPVAYFGGDAATPVLPPMRPQPRSPQIAIDRMTPGERATLNADMRNVSAREGYFSEKAKEYGSNPVAASSGVNKHIYPFYEDVTSRAPATSLRPQARPEGLVSPLAPMNSRRPMPRSPFGAVDRMNPEDRGALTADLRAFATRDPGIARSASASGLNPMAYLGGDAATPTPSYAPTTSLRPQPRPAGLVTGPSMGDLTATGITGGVIPVADMTPKSVPLAARTPTGPQADTGKVSVSTYDPVVPVQTQLDFITHELQKPQYDDYLKTDWGTPERAAVAWDDIYEVSGGVGNDEAKKNARAVYDAAASGDLSGFAPNVQMAYDHFISTGMTPVHAAGATGRLMVESYPHMDPNARNNLAGGNGTYGIAQWRASRMEELAEFAGVPLEDIKNAPASTPEGRYYSGSGVAGPNVASGAPGAPDVAGGLAGSAREPMGGDKAWKDRTALGKMFYDPDGRVNKDALLSILGGIGTMASSPSLYLGSAILQGVGGAANTYAALEKQKSDIQLQGAQVADYASQLFKNSIFYDQRTQQNYIPLANGGVQKFSDWMVDPAGASMAGVEGDRIIRRSASVAARQGFDLDKTNPEEFFATPAAVTDAGSAPEVGAGATVAPPSPGMPVQPAAAQTESFGTFPISDAAQAVIDRNTRTMSGMTTEARTQANEISAAELQAANEASAAASGAFRSLNELGFAMATANPGDIGPAGALKASADAWLKQIAGTFNVAYSGSEDEKGNAERRALLEKLSTMRAGEMTPDQAAAKLFLENQAMFPSSTSDPDAAAEITASMFVNNMKNYEFGQYANDFYAAGGEYPSTSGSTTTFNQETGNLYQAEQRNIAALLKATSDAGTPPNVAKAIRVFFADANAGAFESPQEAQRQLDKIFDAMPGEHGVSSGLGRYFVR